jgi:hypothetical protein
MNQHADTQICHVCQTPIAGATVQTIDGEPAHAECCGQRIRPDGGTHEDETCDHYGAHVGVQLHDLSEKDKEWDCHWCEGTATLGLAKNGRHRLAICDECRQVLDIIDLDGDCDV